jgi:predicted ArsR family transcriptional regulator
MPLDPDLHGPTRLAILAALRRADGPVDFSTLREQLSLTGGNLQSHLRALVTAGVVSSDRVAPLGRARTLYGITPHGDLRLRAHARALRDVADALDR